jgi:hypothetical protein
MPKVSLTFIHNKSQRSNILEHKEGGVFSKGQINGLELRNRVIRAGCFEGMCQNQSPTEALLEHHRAVAAGGVGMTTVSYCSVSRSGLNFDHEMLMRDEIVPMLTHPSGRSCCFYPTWTLRDASASKGN